MSVQQAIKTVVFQLTEALQQVTNEQYTQQSKQMFSATIGQHVRHVIELFICLDNGYESGIINYDARKRDQLIETDKKLAITLLNTILDSIDKIQKPLVLEFSYEEGDGNHTGIATNYQRELLYNLEHTVHHMALIRIGVAEISSIVLPDSFGIASSTIKYREACAQ